MLQKTLRCLAIGLLLFSVISLFPYLRLAYQLHNDPFNSEQEEPIQTPEIPSNDDTDIPQENENTNHGYIAEKVYYVETFHGGLMLGENMTYANLDLLFDALERHPRYKVSFEIESFTWELLNQTYIDKIKDYVNAGRIEICLTTYSQPFLSNLTKQYAQWQLRKGKEVIERLFNVTPQVYVCQEPALRYDIPELLNNIGINKVYGRISWSFFGNAKYWDMGEVLNSDLVTWKYNEYEVILIPYYYHSGSSEWEFFNISFFLDFANENGIPHPLQSCINDLAWWEIYGSNGKGLNYYRWTPNRPLPLYNNGTYSKINDSLTVYTSFSEYIEKIADAPQDTINLDESYFVLNLPDKQERFNETHTYDYDRNLYNVSQFQFLWNKTKELELLWLEIYENNASDPLIDTLGYNMSILYHHDIWVCYQMGGWGMAFDEGFKTWFDFWLFYYQQTLIFLQSNNIIIAT